MIATQMIMGHIEANGYLLLKYLPIHTKARNQILY